MKVALYYPWLYLKSGVEKTILETVKRSRHEYTIFTNHYGFRETYPNFKQYHVIELNKIPVNRNIPTVFKAALTIAVQKINLNNFDLFLVHSEGLGDLALLRNGLIPTVCYCHTPLRPVFDTEYKRRALNKRGLIKKTIYMLLYFLFKTLDRYLWSKYIHIFFNSKTSLTRAKQGGLITKGARYALLSPGCAWKETRPSWVYNKYFLVPGRIMWTKNLELAIEAFKVFSKEIKPYKFKMIIAGQVDKKSEVYFKTLKKRAGFYNIEFIQDLSEAKIKILYRDCYAVLATAFNEDWGLTPIEANAFGKPALCVNNGGFRESQVDGKTGFLLPPTSGAFAQKMIYLYKNPRVLKRIGRSARINSRQYDWQKFIEKFDQTIDSYLLERK